MNIYNGYYYKSNENNLVTIVDYINENIIDKAEKDNVKVIEINYDNLNVSMEIIYIRKIL